MRRLEISDAVKLIGVVALALAAMLAVGKAGAMQPGDYSPTGPDFLVNTTTENYQCCSRIAPLSGGGFVIVWQDTSQTGGDTSGFAIRAQRYSADGTPAGNEFLVNTTTENDQFEPAVAALRGGGFVVVWTSREGVGHFHIRGRIFNASGQGVGGFNHDGAPAPGDFQVNEPVNNVNTSPYVAGFDAGGFVVVWSRQGRAIHARRYEVTGQPGAEIIISQAPGSNFRCTHTQQVHIQCWPRATTLANGGFVVTWSDASHSQTDQSGSAVFARGYNSSSVPMGEEFQVNGHIYGADDTHGDQKAGGIVRTPDGGVVFVWSSWRADLPGTWKDYDIHARRYRADLSPLGEAFRVNTFTQGREVSPSITSLHGGGFLVAWQDDRTDASQQLDAYDIRAQLFDNSFERIDDEFTINTTYSHYQETPSVARWGQRGFITSFTSTAGLPGPGVNYHIRARLYERTGPDCDTETAYAEGGQCVCRIPSMALVSETACACAEGMEVGLDPATGRPGCVPRSCDAATTVQEGGECRCLSTDMERVDQWRCACPGNGRLVRLPGRPWMCSGYIDGTLNPNINPGVIGDTVIRTPGIQGAPATPEGHQRSGAGPDAQPCPPRHTFNTELGHCVPLTCTPPMRLNADRTECVCPAGQAVVEGVCRDTGASLDRAIEILAPVIRDGARPPARGTSPQPSPTCTPGGPVPC